MSPQRRRPPSVRGGCGRGWWVMLALGITALVLACAPQKKVKSADDETGKAFADLEKNDKDDPKAFGAGDAGAADPGGWQKPKGSVYPAPFTAEQIRGAT